MTRNLPSLLILAGSSCLLLAATLVDSATFQTRTEGGLEFELDFSELSELYGPDNNINGNNDLPEDSFILPEYGPDALRYGPGVVHEYSEGTDASLLNNLIEFFIPFINQGFRTLLPDPLAIPLSGTVKLPQVDLLGYCTADADFNVNFGTLTGLSTMSIDRFQVIPGTERATPGWNFGQGCLETVFSVFVDIALSSSTRFVVNDMEAGMRASACGYAVDESITGGINTIQPRMYGTVNISGALIGTKATINFADLRNSALRVGYETLEGFVDGAPPAVNHAIANITSELSKLAKNDILRFMMDETLMRAVEPTVTSRSKRALEGQAVDLSYADSFAFNSAFLKNTQSQKAQDVVDSTLSFLRGIGFFWQEEEEEEGEETSKQDSYVASPEEVPDDSAISPAPEEDEAVIEFEPLFDRAVEGALNLFQQLGFSWGDDGC